MGERRWDLYWGGLNPGSTAYLLCELQLTHISEPYFSRVFTWGYHPPHPHHMTDLEGLLGGL